MRFEIRGGSLWVAPTGHGELLRVYMSGHYLRMLFGCETDSSCSRVLRSVYSLVCYLATKSIHPNGPLAAEQILSAQQLETHQERQVNI